MRTKFADPARSAVLLGMATVAVAAFSLTPDAKRPGISEDIAAYKSFIDRTVSAERIDGFLRYFTAEPHVASSPRNDALARDILEKWKEFGLEDVALETYDVLLSFPKSISVDLVAPQSLRLKIEERGYPEDPDTMNPNIGIPYNAYSRTGDITAPLVYANGGNPQDYDLLEKHGIDIEGKVALVRYSFPYSYRGFKALTAEKRGLAGLLIYSDPKEDGEARGAVFPKGPWGPLSHIQRGGIPYDFIAPGDPLTPGWASKPGARRLTPQEAETLPKIVSVPISAENARPLLESMDGETAPPEWQGALPLTYRLAGSKTRVRMQVEMEDPIRTITDVTGCLKGTDYPDELIVVGNHRDAWVFGGVDPSSGTACMMELARALGEAKRAGFRPRRTVILGSWDAEEFTLTGSTEWGEENGERLRKNLVAYINVDTAAAGRDFNVQGVPSLIALLHEAAKEVEDPIDKKPVYDVWKAGVAGRDGKKEEGRVDPIGSGSDHAVFLQHLGAPALDMSFVGPYGVYHSVYDNYFWMTHFGDPGLKYSAALARIWAHMIIDLACRPVLPLDYETYAGDLRTYVSDWAAKYEPGRPKAQGLLERIERMEKAAAEVRPLLFDSDGVRGIDPARLKRINGLIIGLERAFTDPQGIPRRPWYKHLVYGARYTYAVLLLPALTEASEAGDEQAVDAAIRNLEKAVSTATSGLEQIRSLAYK